MNVVVRKAKLGDANAIAELYLQFWEAHKNAPLLEFKKRLTMRNQVETAKRNIRKRSITVLVAETNGTVAGFIEFFIKKNDECFKIKKYGYINLVVTRKGYRGRGVARKLVQEALRMLKEKGVNYVKTNVYTSNTPAIKAWRRLGFKAESSVMLREVGQVFTSARCA